MITFREGMDVDLDQLGALFRSVGFSRPMDPPLLAGMVTGSRWVVSAWDGVVLVGFARAISDGVANGYISTVAVSPTHQRQGIGRRLIGLLVDDRPGIKWVLHTSDVGRPLYAGHGFVDAPDMLVRPRR